MLSLPRSLSPFMRSRRGEGEQRRGHGGEEEERQFASVRQALAASPASRRHGRCPPLVTAGTRGRVISRHRPRAPQPAPPLGGGSRSLEATMDGTMSWTQLIVVAISRRLPSMATIVGARSRSRKRPPRAWCMHRWRGPARPHEGAVQCHRESR
jgi:hypothetical protein